MKYKIFLLLILNFILINNSIQNEYINLDMIKLDEEMVANYQILNLTDLLINKLNLIKNSVRLESIKFDTNNKLNLNEYFSIDLKKYRLQVSNVDENSINQSAIILLKTSSKKLDREFICRLNTADNTCQCESDCILNLNLISNFRLLEDSKSSKEFSLNLNVPIQLNDLNDNKPFFYKPELLIDLDQIDSNDLIYKVPLKLAVDLDSKQINRVLEYKLEKVSILNENFTNLKHFVDEKNQERLELLIDLNKLNTNENQLKKYFNERFKLVAYDAEFKTSQDIVLKFKLPNFKRDLNQISKKKSEYSDKSVKSNKSLINLSNLVSALNELEIQQINNSYLYDLKFKNNSEKIQIVSNKTDSLITLAYLIIDKYKFNKNQSGMVYLDTEQYLENNNDILYDLFKITEMRNGLYSISIKSNNFDHLKRSNQLNNLINYKIKLTLKLDNISMDKILRIKVPEVLVNSAYSTPILTSTLETLIDANPSTSFYSSIIIVSTASTILVVFGLSCFIISIILYTINKCKDNKRFDKSGLKSLTNGLDSIDSKKEKPNIMVYDVLPNGQKQLPIYSLTSSSSSSCSSSSSSHTNNLSPVTTTTTSIVNETAPIQGPLFDTNLNQWYKPNNPSSSSSSSPISGSSTSQLLTDKLYTTINEEIYKNDILKNSQVLYKKQVLIQKQMNDNSNYYTINLNNDNSRFENEKIFCMNDNVYQARPINLNRSGSIISSPSYSIINDMQLNNNLNSTDNLRDSIKEKMINRLSAALAVNNNNTISLNLDQNGQISCV